MSTDTGTLTAPQARRVRWLVPLVLTIAAIGGWAAAPHFVYVKPGPPPKPGVVYGDSDGLPRELIVGEAYTATFTVTFPADWAHNGWVLVAGRAVPDDRSYEMNDVILCDMSWANPAGQTLTFSCRLEPPSPGPYDLTVGGFFGAGKVYPHIVVPSSRPGSPPP